MTAELQTSVLSLFSKNRMLSNNALHATYEVARA
jgi:hypothetical protein